MLMIGHTYHYDISICGNVTRLHYVNMHILDSPPPPFHHPSLGSRMRGGEQQFLWGWSQAGLTRG
jgi:hypothetical protein